MKAKFLLFTPGNKTKFLFSTLAFLLCYTATYAQPGAVDLSFNPVGTGANAGVNAIAIQGDGLILIGGQFGSYNGFGRFNVARLNADGTLDSSIDPGLIGSGTVRALSIQSDGKFIIGGNFTKGVFRESTNGNEDFSFNTGTGANDFVLTCPIQSDGKIIIGGQFTTFNGTSRNSVARVNTNGSLDATFSVGSGANNVVYASALQSDGKVIIGGSFTSYNGTSINRIARLNTNGTIDGTFNVGTGAINDIYTASIQSDGKIIIGGAFTSYNGTAVNRIARLNTDGTLDATFNVGTGASSIITTSAIQSDGKIIIGGYFLTYNGTSSVRVARLNTDGTLDATFNVGTGPNNYVYACAIQSDGNIIIGGDFTSFNGAAKVRVARIFGSLNTGIAPSPREKGQSATIYPNPCSSQATIKSDNFFENATLTVENCLGQTVLQIENINGKSVSFNRGNLLNGVYFVRMTEATKEIMIKKLIIAD